MQAKGIIVSLLLVTVFSSCGNNLQEQNPKEQQNPSVSREACLNDPDCLCWCSQICNWRKKTAQDHPVYIENDPHGKFCYCKQWDFDYYEDNCILHKDVKQPKGAK